MESFSISFVVVTELVGFADGVLTSQEIIPSDIKVTMLIKIVFITIFVPPFSGAATWFYIIGLKYAL